MELIDLHNLFSLYPPIVQRLVREHFATMVDTIPQGEQYTLPTLDNISAKYQNGHGVYSYVVVVDEIGSVRRKRHTWVFDFDTDL